MESEGTSNVVKFWLESGYKVPGLLEAVTKPQDQFL